MPAIIKVVDGRTIIKMGENSALAIKYGTLAEQFANEAELSAETAALAAAAVGVFPTIADGIGATTDGQAFYVTDGTDFALYRNNAGTGDLVISLPTATDVAARVPYTELASTAPGEGAGLVGFLQDGLGAVDRTVEDKLRERVSVDDFKLAGDADDLFAFERARDYLISIGGGTMYCHSRLYQLGSAFNLTSGDYNIPLTIQCETGTIIEGTGTGNVIKIGGLMFLRGGGIKGNPLIRNAATGGHLLEFGLAACTECVFEVSMEQNNPAKSLIYGPAGEIYKTDFCGSRWTTNVNHTVPPVHIVANGTTVNGNIWRPGRCYNATSSQFFDISNTDTTTWLVNNEITDIEFENCSGGAFKVTNARGWAFRNLEMWDAGLYTGHIGWIADNSGYVSIGNTFERVMRHGDALDTGICDLFLEDCQYSSINNCYNENSAGPRYDLNNNPGISLTGLLYGVVNPSTLSATGGLAPGATSLYGENSISVGGLIGPERYRVTVAGGYVNHDPQANSTGQILTARDGSGVLTKLVFSSGGDFFYSLTDNKTNLGNGANRFKEVFAATGTVNTCDEREKTWRGGLSEHEYAAALRIVDELGFYQWNDAIAEKGPDDARYHFGVRAQRVWAIMADEGLVNPISGGAATAQYAFLCYDEWDDYSVPITDIIEGEIVETGATNIKAGNRFGIRIDQMTLFLLAAQARRQKELEQRIEALE